MGNQGCRLENMVRWQLVTRGAEMAGGARVYCPASIAEAKKSKLEALGAHLTFAKDCGSAECQARSDARALGLTYVSPYNDVQVLQGPAPPEKSPLLKTKENEKTTEKREKQGRTRKTSKIVTTDCQKLCVG